VSALVDAIARKRIETDLDRTIVVEAAAGTGKTTALVARIVAVIRSGRTSLDRVVAVTFTEKAAGEMKLRLRTELDRARLAAESASEAQHLERALAALEIAHINTIHGFCADLLRERPVEAGIDPAFEVLDEAAAETLLRDAFRSWFERALSEPGPGLRRILRRRNWRKERTTPREDLLKACRTLVENRDFDAPWSAPEFARERAIDELVERFRALGALHGQARRSSDQLAQAMATFKAWVARLDARERAAARDYDGLEAELTDFQRADDSPFKRSGYGKLYGDSLDRTAVLKERDAAKAALDEFVALAGADLAAQLRAELTPVVQLREALKQRLGALDFVDLLARARDLLKSNRGARAQLQARFSHLFVDEFQDTDPIQAEILLLLAADDPDASNFRQLRLRPGKLFIVGDPKQSIYRFRRADVMLYQRIKADLLAQGAELLHLTTNFRSVPSIQAAVNVSFSKWMTGSADGSQAEYVALSQFRPETEGQPGVVALPVPEPYGDWGRMTKKAVSASFPNAVGAFVRWLLHDSGWQVREGDEFTNVKPRHICLLFKRFQAYEGDVTRLYVRALEARRIPHMLVGGRSFHDREEVVAIRTALDAIEWPDDELSVYSTLRGPLLAVSDEDLLCFRQDFPRLNPLQSFDAAQRAKHPVVTDALELLRSLHNARNRRPIADTVERLLAETRAHASLALWPSGEQALANALAIVDLARNFDTRGATSFRGFIETLAEQADRGEGGEAPIVEEGTEGVRLMTVHKAKGLEFPVVILCDPTAPSSMDKAYRFVDSENRLWAHALCGCSPLELSRNEALARQHDNAELVRLSYVAATRAQDLLVVPVFGDASERSVSIGWADVLAPGLYPASGERRAPRAAPGCPPFGADSVSTRSASSEATAEDSVAPGLHFSEHGQNPVVWWDPTLLELRAETSEGVRQQRLLASSTEGERGLVEYQQWLASRSAAIAHGSEPSISALPITELAKRASGRGPRAEVQSTDVNRERRPRGPRFGTLVHALLAHAPLDSERETLLQLSAALARLLGSSAEEIIFAADAAWATLAHPLLREARRSRDVRREVSVSSTRADGSLAEGVIDLAFRSDSGWVVVDFKTDELVATEGIYAEQLQLYVDAVQKATGEPTRGVLLRV
jgi:ATP-dependent exoDNAse (exonuclease V) beta subunit